MAQALAELDTRSLPEDVETLHAIIRDLMAQTQRLEHRLQQLLRQRYGASAEKLDRAQLLLFAREILEAKGCEEAGEDATPLPASARRNGRRRLPRELPRIRIEHDLPAGDKRCPCCGTERKRIGEEVSERLDYEPAKLHVIEDVRFTYACPRCEGEVATAPKPRRPIEKCLAGAGLLAQVAVSKYGDHLPLYRLERIFQRHGVEIARSTMCGWMAGCAEALSPLARLMQREVLSSKVIHSDDSPVPVQEKGRGKTKQGRFWVYVGDREHPYAVFDYTPDRKQAGPLSWLKSYTGYLQADAYGGYDVLYTSCGVEEVACWAHARRKFYEARLTDPGRCHQALAWIRKLYGVEREAKDLSDEERCALRQAKSVPLLSEFKRWLDEESGQVLPKSPTAEAIRYVRSRWASFTRYTQEGFLKIDNNAAENALRRVALGRKNWLFAGSDRGGETAAVLFTLIASCQMHHLDPYAWLRDALRRIPDIRQSRLVELLPDRWQAELDPASTAAA